MCYGSPHANPAESPKGGTPSAGSVAALVIAHDVDAETDPLDDLDEEAAAAMIALALAVAFDADHEWTHNAYCVSHTEDYRRKRRMVEARYEGVCVHRTHCRPIDSLLSARAALPQDAEDLREFGHRVVETDYRSHSGCLPASGKAEGLAGRCETPPHGCVAARRVPSHRFIEQRLERSIGRLVALKGPASAASTSPRNSRRGGGWRIPRARARERQSSCPAL